MALTPQQIADFAAQATAQNAITKAQLVASLAQLATLHDQVIAEANALIVIGNDDTLRLRDIVLGTIGQAKSILAVNAAPLLPSS